MSQKEQKESNKKKKKDGSGKVMPGLDLKEDFYSPKQGTPKSKQVDSSSSDASDGEIIDAEELQSSTKKAAKEKVNKYYNDDKEIEALKSISRTLELYGKDTVFKLENFITPMKQGYSLNELEVQQILECLSNKYSVIYAAKNASKMLVLFEPSRVYQEVSWDYQ